MIRESEAFCRAFCQWSGNVTSNLVTNAPGFVDAAHYDYRLAARSPALQTGIDPGKAGDFPLMPRFVYHHPLGSAPLPQGKKFDLGACPAADR